MRNSYARLIIEITLLASMTPLADAQLACSSCEIFFAGSSVTIGIVDRSGAHVKFKYVGVDAPPNFLLVVPSSGTTPAQVQLALNPNVAPFLAPSTTAVLLVKFTTVDQTPSQMTAALVTYKVPPAAPLIVQSVLNAASLQPILSPGALVSILGSKLTGPTLTTTFDDTGSYPTSVANTSVTFNGIAAPLLYVSPSQINAIVPFSLAGQSSVQVAVQCFQQTSAPVAVPLQDTAPAVFTSSQTGTGQAAVLQVAPDGSLSYNSRDNPAHAGQYLEIFATGQGPWNPPPQSDIVVLPGRPPTTLPVSLTLGGQPAKIVYAGTVGGITTWSVLQVNATVPNGLIPGDQSMILKIGANDNSLQNVTVAVK